MSQLAKYIIGIAVTAVVLFLVWYFSSIVAYILVSAVLAIVGKPMVDWLLRLRVKGMGVPRWAAALLTLITLWSLGIVFLMFFIPLVLGKMQELSNLDVSIVIEAFKTPLQSVQDFMTHFFAIQNDNFSLVNEVTEQLRLLFNLDHINNALSSAISLVGSTVVALFSITFITFFFLKQDNLFRNMVVAVFPKKYEPNIERALDSVTNLLIRYFIGILLQSTIIMLILSSILMLWGFSAQTAFFMGVLMGVMNVIPYIGPLIGGVICVIVGIISPLEGASLASMIMIIGGSILLVKGVDDFILQPLIYSNSVRAHPLEIFIVILIAGSLAGVLGMLLAIPMYTVLRVFAKEFFNNFQLVQKLTENI